MPEQDKTYTALQRVADTLDAVNSRIDALETGSGSKNPLKADKRKDDAKADKRKDEEEKEPEAKGDDEEEKEEKKADAKAECDDDDDDDAKKDQALPAKGGTGATSPPPVAADKKRKDDDGDLELKHEGKEIVQKGDKKKDAKKDDDDDEEEEAKKDAAKADAVGDLRRQVAAQAAMMAKQAAMIERLETQIRPRTEEEHDAFAAAQAKADTAFMAFGKRAPRPMEGEMLLRYRKRLATVLKPYSPMWRDPQIKFSELPDATFNVAETQVYADAIAAAASPNDLAEGELRPIVRKDHAGREITTFVGKESFVKGMGHPNRMRVVRWPAAERNNLPV